MSVYNDLFVFLIRPSDDNRCDEPVLKKLTAVLRLLLLGIGVGILCSIIIWLLANFKIIDPGYNSLSDFILLPFYKIVLFGVLLLPFFEEVLFRLPLRFKSNYIYRFIFYIIRNLWIFNIEKTRLWEHRIWNSIYKYFFYALTITFAFVHISNYDNANKLMLFIPVLTFSQFFNGLIIGYVRVRYGFLYGYIYHAFFNFVFISITILSLTKSVSLNYVEDNYKIEIKSDIASNSKNKYQSSNSKVTADTIEFENMGLKTIISYLSHTPEKYITDNSSFLRQKFFVKASFKTSEENADSSRQILLQQVMKSLKIKIINKKTIQKANEMYFAGRISMDLPVIYNGSERKTTLKNIGRLADTNYKNEYIFSQDTSTVTINKIPYGISFTELQHFLKAYGIEFRKVEKELEFNVIVNVN